MLEELDRVPWGELDSAFTSDEGVPGLLRIIATGDEDAAVDALHELRWEILHQGTLYESTAPSVRFLAELLAGASGAIRGHLLDLLGDLAHSYAGDPEDEAGADVNAAVTAQVDVILPLLADADPWVRYSAAYALAGCPDRADDATSAIRERWAVEADPRVRAGLVMAAADLDRRTDLVEEALAADQPPAVRAGAVLAIVESGRRWPGKRAVAAVREAWRDGDPFASGADDRWHPTLWFPNAIKLLLTRLPAADKPSIVGALLDSPDRKVRLSAAIHAGVAVAGHRSVRPPLVEVLTRSLTDPDPQVRLAAAAAVRRAGPAAAEAADALAAVADHHADEVAGQAVAALVELGDPRGMRRLPAQIEAGIAADDIGFALVALETPATPELLDAVRHRLAVLARDLPPERDFEAIRQSHRQIHFLDSELTTLLMLVESWGPAAAPAVAELLGLLPVRKTVVTKVIKALGAIGPDASAALPALREYAEADRIENELRQERLAATRACWRLTGDPEPAIDQAWRHITDDGDSLEAIELLAQIGEPAHRLLPSIRQAQEAWLRDAELYLGEMVKLAGLAWRWTGDEGLAVPTIRAFLDRYEPGLVYWGQTEAVILAVEMGLPGAVETMTGPPAFHERPFRQALRGYRALWRLTGDADFFLTPLVTKLTSAESAHTKTNWTLSLDLLTELGPAAAPVLPALRKFADRDQAVADADAGESPGHADEQVRAAILATISAVAGAIQAAG